MARVTRRFPSRFNPFRPIYVMRTEEVTREEKEAALEALEDILEIADVKGKIQIVDFDVWRPYGYKDRDGRLVPHMSVDWYVEKGWDPKRKQVDTRKVLNQLLMEPCFEEQPHYDVILTALDLYDPGTNFLVGAALERRAMIISVGRFREVKDVGLRRELIKQETYHEMGHVFGLPRSCSHVENCLGLHCTDLCVMRQGLYVPDDWIGHTQERLNTGIIYCPACEKDLKDFFRRRV